MIITTALLFFLVALIYSSAGFGGGSSYLSILSQFPYSSAFIRFTGLSCNTLVTTAGTFNFYKKGWIAWKPLLALLACSIPFCLWSSSWRLETNSYFITLGSCLLVAGLAMLFQHQSRAEENKVIRNPWWLYFVCAAIGLLSGYTGIGGGVYLSPLLHLIRWGTAKHIAATCSAFILLNSIAGLLVQFINNTIEWHTDQLWLLIAVFLGGLIGSRMSSSIFSQKTVLYITSGVIIFAATRILTTHL